MTAKELKRLRRSDLLEMLLTLRKENEQLRQQLECAQKQLENKKIEIDNSGSLAEAALRLNGIFEAAHAACEQYTENIRQRLAQQELEAQQKCEEMLAQAKQQADEYSRLTDVAEESKTQEGLE